MQEFIDEDKILYRSFLKGDQKAFEKIILKYKNNLIYFIFKYVKDKDIAEDIFQDVAVYLMERKEVYDFKYSFKTFLYMVAKSKALNYLRDNKNNLSIHSQEENLYVEEEILEEIIFSEELKDKLKNVLSKMKAEYQMVIYLTMIEELSYEETAKIMDKTVSQIKNLVHRARTKLKKLLIEEKVVELKGNKIIKLLTPFIVITLIAGITYAGVKIYQGIKGKANLTPTFTGEGIDINSAWVGTFQIAWNEFIEECLDGKIVEFDDGTTLDVVDELNKMEFTKDNLSEDDYYVIVSKAEPSLKKEILENLDKKFGIKNSPIVELLDFNKNRKSYIIYAMLVKNFEFLTPFDRLQEMPFNEGDTKVKYFGINGMTDEEVYKNIEVLFYNDNDDCAVKLFTKEGEELILYKTNSDKSFNEIYEEVERKTEKYNGERKFVDGDYFKAPYIEVNTIINYDELCGKTIKGTNGVYIEKALQNVEFSLNEKGGSLISNAAIQGVTLGISAGRSFVFNDSFVIFMKEENKDKPYFALRIDNTDLLIEKELLFIDREVNQQMIDKLKEAENNTEFIRVFDRYCNEDVRVELFERIYEELEENPREKAIPPSLSEFYQLCQWMPGNGMYEDELEILNKVFEEVDFRKLEEDL